MAYPWKSASLLRAVLFGALAMFLPFPQQLRADAPERNMANVQITDHGDQLTVSWHFFYFLLPEHLVLHEKQDEPISLAGDDVAPLKKNLADIAQVAFVFTVDGRKVQPTLLDLTLYPNRSCLVLMSFPGRSGARVDMEAPVLKYFPPAYFLNVSFSSMSQRSGASFGKRSPPTAHFVQGEVPLPPAKPYFSRDFVAEFGAAWVNYNWILTCVVLLVMRRLKQIAGLIVSIVVSWIFLCFASAVFDYSIHTKVPQIALCIPTLLVCLICGKYPKRGVLLTLVTIAGGALNACYDIQQIPLSVPAQTLNAMTGLALGFAGGMGLVLLVLLPLWWEGQKYPGFQETWAPKIAWAAAALAVLLPLQKMVFG